MRHVMRPRPIGGEGQVRGWLAHWGGPPLEADLVIAGGAASGVRVALGVS